VNEIVRGKRGVSPETAWLLSGALGTTPKFWANLQAQHDLAVSRPARPVRRLRRTG
jgi:addiction module HigA family antidote